MTYAIPAEPLSRLRIMVAEGRIVRHKWQATDDRGRETACLLGALGRKIDSVSACPAEYMPAWLAHLTPHIDDSVSAEQWSGIIRRYADLAGRWQVLTDDAWERVRLRTNRASLMIALPHDAAGVVEPVIALVDRALAGERVPAKGWTAAWAAAETAWAAEAKAAKAAAWAAAEAAAWAAKAAAEAAAWDKIAGALLDAIEHEVNAVPAGGSVMSAGSFGFHCVRNTAQEPAR